MDFANYWYSSGEAGQPNGGDTGDPIQGSLRFRGQNQRLRITHDGSSWGTQNTFSWWVKRSSLGTNHSMWSSTSSWYMNWFKGTDVLGFSSPEKSYDDPNRYFRDTSAWCHIMAVRDGSTYATYVNGEFYGPGFIQIDSSAMSFGDYNGANYFHGYLAEVHCVNGQALGPESFGRLNEQNIWVPVRYTGDHGPKGFHYDFDPSDPTRDLSGNGNVFTPYNMELVNSSAPEYDLVSDSPTNNWSHWQNAVGRNQDSNYSKTLYLEWGNMAMSSSNSYAGTITNTGYYTSGLWCLRLYQSTGNSSYYGVVAEGSDWYNTQRPDFPGYHVAIDTSAYTTYVRGHHSSSPTSGNASNFTYDSGYTPGAGSVIWCLLDMDNRRVRWDVDGNLGPWYDLNQDFPPGMGVTFWTSSSGVARKNYDWGQTGRDPYPGYQWPTLANMPAPEHIDGREYFQTLLAPGDGVTAGVEGDFESNWTLSGNGWTSGQGPDKIFDGNLSTFANNQAGGQDFTWNVSSYNFVGELEVYAWSTNGLYSAQVDGVEVIASIGDQPALQWYSLGTVNNPSTIFFTSSGNNAGLYPAAFRLNGEFLIQNTGVRGGGWSQYLYNVNDAPMTSIENGFNGDTTTANAAKGSSMTTMIFELPTPLEYTSEVRLWANTSAQVWVDGVKIWDDAYAGNYGSILLTGPGSFKKIEIRPTSGTPWWNGIAVDGETLVDYSILSLARSKFPNGLWWIKSRTSSNEYQLMDTVVADGAEKAGIVCPGAVAARDYQTVPGQGVAWCWDASNPSQTGFNIIKSTTSGAGAVAHGLPSRPAFFIFKQYTITDNIYTWHQEYEFNGTAWQYQTLNGSAAVTYGGSNLVLDVDETNITFGSAVTQPQIIYAWSEIPGYSKMGKWKGNNQTDGVFIWTGFRPTWILIKRRDIGDSWVIQDGTRQRNNPVYRLFFPDASGPESTSASYGIDLLSNGFKIWTGVSQQGGSGIFTYMAFAEHPAGGQGLAPATVR